MSQRIKYLVSKGYSEIARELYSFLEKHHHVPETHYIEQIVKSAQNPNELGNNLNAMFLEHLRQALIEPIAAYSFDKFSREFCVKHYANEADSTEDSFEIRFLDRKLDYIDDAVLEDLYLSIQRYQRLYLEHNRCSITTLALEASHELIGNLLAIEQVDSYLYQSIVEPTDGRRYETHILHIGAIERLHNAMKFEHDDMLAIWELLKPYWNLFDTSNTPSYPELIALNVKAN